MTFISIVINCDTRSGFQDSESNAEAMFNGCRSIDFLIDGVQNKIDFFKGFETEVILFVDEHNPIPESVMRDLRVMVDTLVVRKHNKRFGDMKEFQKFNDLNYLSALQLARGEYVAHFDQDCMAFTRTPETVNKLIEHLNRNKFVSYPSFNSPVAVYDHSFDYIWASTRFFICKRETLDFTEYQKCLLDSDYLYSKYPASRHCPWLEHILGLTSKSSVYYPQIELNDYAIFCWNRYVAGTIGKLNAMNYGEVKNYIDRANGICYPCDIAAIPI